MAKVLITNNNIPYDNSYKNVLKFESEIDRNSWIDTNLHTNWEVELETQPNVNFKIINPLNNSIELNVALNNILDKNYLIIKQSGKITFWFINSIRNTGNNNKWILDLELDIFMNYFDMFDNIKDFNLVKGHSNPINYLAYEQDGGDKRIVSLDKLKRVSTNEVYQQMNEKTWLYVLEKIGGTETGILKNGKGGNLQEPFKVFVAPLTPLQVVGNGTGTLWEGNSTRVTTTSSDLNLTDDEFFIFSDAGISEFNFTLTGIPSNGLRIKYDTTYLGDNAEVKDKIYFINQELLPENINDEVMILLPIEERSESDADYINKILKNNGIFNEELKLAEVYYSLVNSYYLRFLPQIVRKINDNSYSFRNALKKEEIAIRLPRSYYLDRRYGHIWYYSDYVNDGLIGYGVVINKNDNTSDGDGVYLNIKEITGVGTTTWNSASLFQKLSDTTENANVISAFISNFNPVETTQETGLIDRTLIGNITSSDNKITSIDYATVLKNNIYKEVIEKPFIPDFISGISKYSIILENQKEFEVDYSFINYDEVNDEYYYEFTHYASLTPEWEERLKKYSTTFIDITNDDNAWVIEKSFVKGTDAFAEYKSQNPVSSKMDFLKPFTNPFAFLSPTTLAVNALGSTGSTVVQHQNMKHKPIEFSGSGDALGDLIFNEFGNSFLLAKWKYLGVERDNIIRNLYKYGIAYNNYYEINEYDTIKRPIFNFIQTSDLNESSFLINANKEVTDKINEIWQNGFRIWNDKTKYLDFTVDNGDSV